MRFVRMFCLVLVLGGVFVSSASAIAFADEDYFWPNGTVGEPYFKQLIGRADFTQCTPKGSGQCTYSFLSGQFPPGIVLSSNGQVTGTPTMLGTWSFWLAIYDCCGKNAQREFTLSITSVKLSVRTNSLRPAQTGTPYSATLEASSGTGLQWTLTDGAVPPGTVLNSNGTITGTPTTVGQFTFIVKVTNPANGKSDTKRLTIAVAEALGISAPSARVGEVGRPFTGTVVRTGGTSPYAWSITAGVPPSGVTFDSTTGVFSGTPTAAGAFPLTISVTDANGFSKTLATRLTVVGTLTIATNRLRGITVGRRFAAKLRIQGGARPLTWTRIRGALPRGIRFDVTRGAFVGTARAAGTFRVTVRVRDSLNALSTKTLVLSVRA